MRWSVSGPLRTWPSDDGSRAPVLCRMSAGLVSQICMKWWVPTLHWCASVHCHRWERSSAGGPGPAMTVAAAVLAQVSRYHKCSGVPLSLCAAQRKGEVRSEVPECNAMSLPRP